MIPRYNRGVDFTANPYETGSNVNPQCVRPLGNEWPLSDIPDHWVDWAAAVLRTVQRERSRRTHTRRKRGRPRGRVAA